MLYFIMLLGLVSIVLMLTTLKAESRSRKKHAAKLLHTNFISRKENIQPVSLRTTQVTIGRLPSNDICLEAIDPQNRISRVHCVLWWAGTHFRIAPKYTTRLKKFKLQTSRPVVYVDGCPAPEGSGLSVPYGATITICGHEFTLVDTAPDAQERPYYNGILLREKTRPAVNQKPRVKRHTHPAARAMAALLALVLAFCVAVGTMLTWVESPATSESPIGPRKEGTAAILVCGTDREGDRTDTIMLCLISKEDHSVNLLSIPRDLRTTNTSGKIVRMNAIYGNRGQAGMEDLMNNVATITGYRPDGYVVFNWDLVKTVVDNMGGLTVKLDHDITVDDISFPAGEQTLNGAEVLAALRYRAGYVNADIGRVEVQRIIVKACMEQWLTVDQFPALLEQASYVLDNAITDLSLNNVAWLGMTFFSCRSDLQIRDTVVPTTPVYTDRSYKGERAVVDELLRILNTDFNPFQGEITADHLNITK